MNSSHDDWRNYFSDTGYSIFEVIEVAIMVAASDYPHEFRVRRDSIAELLFSYNCARVELAVADEVEALTDEGETVTDCGSANEEGTGYSATNDVTATNANHVSNYSSADAEAMMDENEEENDVLGEILRIKEVLDNWEDESESVLLESLRKLQLMPLTIDNLKTTEVGKAVNLLKKHCSKQIRYLSRALIKEWVKMVDEWVIAKTDVTPDSVNQLVSDEEGLPPLQSESVLLESLRKLQLMPLTIDNLKTTEVGKAVNLLKKHCSKQIRYLSRALIKEWVKMVDEWVIAKTDVTPDSVNQLVSDEEGLPPLQNLCTEPVEQMRLEAAKRNHLVQSEQVENERKQMRV